MTKLKNHLQKGISLVGIVLIFLLIIVLGAGAYFGYQFLNQPSQSAFTQKLIPQSLSKYLVGENAESFLILNNNDAVKKLISESAAKSGQTVDTSTLNDFENAVVIFKGEEMAILLALQFKTKESTEQFKALYSQLIGSYGLFLPALETKLENNILVIQTKNAPQVLTGSFLNNPRLQEIKNYADSQLIGYYDHTQSVYGQLLLFNTINTIVSAQTSRDYQSSNLPRAHAQEAVVRRPTSEPSLRSTVLTSLNYLINTAEKTIISIKIDDTQITSTVITKIIEKDNFKNTATFKMAAKRYQSASSGDENRPSFEELTKKALEGYDLGIKSIQDNLTELQNSFADFSANNPDQSLQLDFSNNTLTFTHSITLSAFSQQIEQ